MEPNQTGSARCNLHQRKVFFLFWDGSITPLVPPAPGYPVAISRSVVGATSNQDCAALCQTGQGWMFHCFLLSDRGEEGGEVRGGCSARDRRRGRGKRKTSSPPLPRRRTNQLLAGGGNPRLDDKLRWTEEEGEELVFPSFLLHSTLYSSPAPPSKHTTPWMNNETWTTQPPKQPPVVYERRHLTHPQCAPTHQPARLSRPSPLPVPLPSPS